MSISTRTRFEIFKRDKFTCQYCGRTPPAVVLHADHILAKSKGGSDERINIVTSCRDCNLGKSNVSLGDVIEPLAAQISNEKERHSQMRKYNQWLAARKKEKNDSLRRISDVFVSLCGQDSQKFVMTGDILKSVKRFMVDIPEVKIIECLHVANEKIGFKDDEHRACRYFYGCCWTIVRGEEH